MKDVSEIVKTLREDRKNPFYFGMTIILFAMIGLLVLLYLKGVSFLRTKDFFAMAIVFVISISILFTFRIYGVKYEKIEESRLKAEQLYEQANSLSKKETNNCGNGYVFQIEDRNGLMVATIFKNGDDLKHRDL